ncbi:MFS transporter [Umezawaea sp.]|uniref:MFS transporter n=1 Tax=Umezawaea sp. TaxID=1955258 RepID=UPI002ECFE537
MTAVSRAHRGLFGCGVLLGLIAEQMVLFAVPLLIFQDTGSVGTLGLAFALEWLPALIAYPFAGLLADRDGGARLFSRVTGGRAVVLAVVALICLLAPSFTTAALLTSGVVLSVLVAPVRMSIEKMVPQLARGERLAPMQSLVQNMELLAMALGPALALLAALVVGKVWLLVVAATVFAVAAACWLPLPRGERVPGRSSAREILAELGLGWTLLLANRPVVLLGSLNFSINLVFATVLSANAALITGVFRAPESSFALLNTCVGVTGLLNLLAIPFLLRKVPVEGLGVFGFALAGVGLVVLGVAPSFLVYGPAFVLSLAGIAYFNVFNRTQRVRVIPSAHLGKVMGPFYLLNLLSYPIGGLLVAGVGSAFGPQRLVALLAVLLCVVGSVLLPLTIRGFRRALAASAPVPAGGTA